MDLWFRVILIVAGSYAGVCVIAYFIQGFFLFHPEKLSQGFRFEYDIPFEEVVIPGPKGSIIDALYFPVHGAQQVVFYFKGNTRSIKGWAKFAKDFTSKGYNFFMIDYPGFGKSTGKLNERNIYRNAQVAYEWLAAKHAEDDIIIYGRSLGAGFAARIASWNNPRMLVLDSPYYNFIELARYYTRILPLRWLLKFKMPLYQFVKKATCPVFIIHGSKDWMIPYRYSPRIVAIDSKRIKLFTIKGAHHNNLPKQQPYHESLNRILNDEKLYHQYKPA